MVFVPRRSAEPAPASTPEPLPPAPARRTGRPSGYTDEIAQAICAGLGRGELLQDICNQPGMPSRATVHRWTEKDEIFRDAFTRARINQAHALAEQTVSLADEALNLTAEE